VRFRRSIFTGRDHGFAGRPPLWTRVVRVLGWLVIVLGALVSLFGASGIAHIVASQSDPNDIAAGMGALAAPFFVVLAFVGIGLMGLGWGVRRFFRRG